MHPWAAMVAPAGTPARIVAQLQRDLVAALETAEVRGRADQAGFDIEPSTPDALRARMASDRALYAPLIGEGRIATM